LNNVTGKNPMLPNQTFTDHLLRPASESPRTLSERAYLAVRQDIRSKASAATAWPRSRWAT